MNRCSRIDLRWNIILTADDMYVDIVAMTTLLASVHSQRMLGNLAQHRKLKSLSANQIGIN